MDTVKLETEPLDEPIYDARGLVELDARVPKVAEIHGERAQFDARNMTTRRINMELRWLLYEQGVTDVTIANPGRTQHSRGEAAAPE